jgi:5-methylcytosine-specific restriction endonuclease McrA
MENEEQADGQGQHCSVCRKWRLLNMFSPRKRGGYYKRCKACEAERRRVYIAANYEALQAKKRQLYYDNVELSRAKNRARYQANIEHLRAKDRERAARPEYREKRRLKLRVYYTSNQDREQALGRERSRRWRKEHREQKADQGRRRRARLALTPGAHTEAQRQALKARYGYRCLRCGRCEPEVALTRDHMIPLGLPGASDAIDNIQLLCGPCNSWKGRRRLDYRAV